MGLFSPHTWWWGFRWLTVGRVDEEHALAAVGQFGECAAPGWRDDDPRVVTH